MIWPVRLRSFGISISLFLPHFLPVVSCLDPSPRQTPLTQSVGTDLGGHGCIYHVPRRGGGSVSFLLAGLGRCRKVKATPHLVVEGLIAALALEVVAAGARAHAPADGEFGLVDGAEPAAKVVEGAGFEGGADASEEGADGVVVVYLQEGPGQQHQDAEEVMDVGPGVVGTRVAAARRRWGTACCRRRRRREEGRLAGRVRQVGGQREEAER